MNTEAEPIEVVTLECFFENFANLDKATRSRQLRLGPADRQIVPYYLLLLNCTPCDPTQFQELGIPEVLHAKPDPGSQNQEHDRNGPLSRDQNEQAQQPTCRGNPIKQDHDLPVGEAAFHQLVMDVLAVGGKQRLPVQKTPNHRDDSVQYGQPERDYRNTDSN